MCFVRILCDCIGFLYDSLFPKQLQLGVPTSFIDLASGCVKNGFPYKNQTMLSPAFFNAYAYATSVKEEPTNCQM